MAAPADTSFSPLPPPPRRVHLGFRNSLGLWALRLFMFPHTLVGLGAIGFLLWTLLWAFAASTFPATVTGGETHTRKGHTLYTLFYCYHIADRTFTDHDDVPQSVYYRYTNSGHLDHWPVPATVRHFALGPFHKATLSEAQSPWATVGGVTFFAIFWNSILSAFLYQVCVVPWRTHRLVRLGQATTGTITSLTTISRTTRSGEHTTYYAAYHFHDTQSNRAITTTMTVPNHRIWQQASKGQQVTILYHPANPRHSIIYELSGYTVHLPCPSAEPENPYAMQ